MRLIAVIHLFFTCKSPEDEYSFMEALHARARHRASASSMLSHRQEPHQPARHQCALVNLPACG